MSRKQVLTLNLLATLAGAASLKNDTKLVAAIKADAQTIARFANRDRFRRPKN